MWTKNVDRNRLWNCVLHLFLISNPCVNAIDKDEVTPERRKRESVPIPSFWSDNWSAVICPSSVDWHGNFVSGWRGALRSRHLLPCQLSELVDYTAHFVTETDPRIVYAISLLQFPSVGSVPLWFNQLGPRFFFSFFNFILLHCIYD